MFISKRIILSKLGSEFNETTYKNIMIGGDTYEYPFKVNELFDNGWEVEDYTSAIAVYAGAPDSLHSKTKAENITLVRKNRKIRIEVYNPADNSASLGNCLVSRLRFPDLDWNLEEMFYNGEKEFNLDDYFSQTGKMNNLVETLNNSRIVDTIIYVSGFDDEVIKDTNGDMSLFINNVENTVKWNVYEVDEFTVGINYSYPNSLEIMSEGKLEVKVVNGEITSDNYSLIYMKLFGLGELFE